MENILIPKQKVQEMLSIGESTLYRKIKSGMIPKPIKLGENTSKNLWVYSEIAKIAENRAS